MAEVEDAAPRAPTAAAAVPTGRVHLLWTGGWDSTFRLLQLLLQHRVPVVPHYLEDATRASTPVELATMARIRARLHAAHPHTRGLLHPLRIARVADVPADADIDAALAEVRTRLHIGDQYAWLPAYCRIANVPGLELGVHVDDKVQALVRPLALAFVHPAGFRSVRVDPRHADTAEFRLFGGFTFPLFHVDKRAIERQAAAAGWSELMELTWFCHAPVRGRPCGVCPPCIYTIEEGLARRVPLPRRLLSSVYRRLALPLKAPARRLRAALRGTRPRG